MRPNRMRRLAVVFGTALFAGCFQYVPARPDQVPLGAQVRVQLSTRALEGLRTRLEVDERSGVLRGTRLDARLVAADPQRAILSMPWIKSGDIFSSKPLRQEVDVPWSDITDMQLKRLDRKKTGGVVAVAAVAIGVIGYKVITGWTGGPTGQPGEPGPVEARIPAQRVLFWR